jgi:hypothetical protein
MRHTFSFFIIIFFDTIFFFFTPDSPGPWSLPLLLDNACLGGEGEGEGALL